MFKEEKRHKNETNKNWEWKEEDVSTCIRPKTLFSWSICRKCQPTKLSLELRTVALTLTLLNFSKDFLKHARPREEVFYSLIAICCCNVWQFYQLFLRKTSEIAYAMIFTSFDGNKENVLFIISMNKNEIQYYLQQNHTRTFKPAFTLL